MGDLSAHVQEAIDGLVARGDEAGLQVGVVHRGEVVVDAVAGRADVARGTPVAPDTLFFAASTAKGLASAVAHVLVERGELAYDLRAVDVWPEVGAHGKAAMTLRHVLLHTAGVPALPAATTVADLGDGRRIADAEPWWPPGTRFGYHAHTFGFLLGEIVRRATGRTLPWWLRELITGPLGVEDEVHFGVPPALLDRVARQEPPADAGNLPPGTPADRAGTASAPAPGPPLGSPAGRGSAASAPVPRPPPGSPADRAQPPALRPSAALFGDPAFLTADTLSHGTMTARGAARVYAALLGHVEGVELVSPGRLRAMAAVAYEGPDEVMGMASTWAFGFSPYRPGAPPRPGSTFGMVGANGSAAFADIDTGVAVAVMRNRFGAPGLAAAAEVDRLVAAAFPPVRPDPT